MEYLTMLSHGMRQRRVRSRLIRYRQMLINAGINLELAEQAVKIWCDLNHNLAKQSRNTSKVLRTRYASYFSREL